MRAAQHRASIHRPLNLDTRILSIDRTAASLAAFLARDPFPIVRTRSHIGYLLLGTVIFGIATVVLLPTGIYQALSYLILPADSGVYRPGAGDSLPGGLVTLPVWLIYLWLVVRDARGDPRGRRLYRGGPPGEPSGVGAGL